MNWSFYEALSRLPLGAAVTIEFIGPLTVALIGSRRLIDLVWVGLAGGGVAILGLGGSHAHGESLDTVGMLLALLAGGFWGAYIYLSKRVGSHYTGLDGLATALAFGGVLLLPAGIAESGRALWSVHILLGGLAVALLSSVIPYSLELTALRRLSPAAFGLLMSLEPAVAAVAGIILLGQALHLNTAAAMIMVVLASVGSTLSARQTTEPKVV